MQHQPSGSRGLSRDLRVNRIADQWCALVLHVHPDLVGAAGVKVTQYQCRARRGISADDFVIGDRSPARRRCHHCHFLAVPAVAPDVCEYGLSRGNGDVLGDTEIDFFIAARGKLSDQMLMSFVIFRDDQAAGCILVESMYDAWSFYAADPGKLALAVVEKGVYQRTIMVANGRVYHHSVFLVDDYHVLILKKDLQWNLLGLRLCGHGFGNIDADVVALLDPIARLGGVIIAKNPLLTDQFLNAGT